MFSWVCVRRGGVQDGCFFGPLVARGRAGGFRCSGRAGGLWADVPEVVVSGVRHDENVGVALLPLPGGNQSVEQVTQLPGCDGGVVVSGGQAKRVQGAVQELRPGSSAQMIEYGQPGTGMCWSLPRP